MAPIGVGALTTGVLAEVDERGTTRRAGVDAALARARG